MHAPEGSGQQLLAKTPPSDSPPVEPAQVCVVTVTYADRYACLQQTVSAALAAGVSRVIIVDNASAPASRTRMRSLARGARGRVTVLHMRENQGSAGGFKAGLEYAMAHSGCDYFWLLDDDNVAGPRTLPELLQAYARICRTQPGARLAVQCFREQRFFHGIAHRERPVRARQSVFLGFHIAMLSRVFHARSLPWRRLPTARCAAPLTAVEIPTGTYGGLFLSRALVDTIGYPNEQLYVYVDDTEYTHRISQRGGRLFLIPASVLHDIDRSFHMTSKPINFLTRMRQSLLAADPFRAYYATRNQAYFDRHMLRRNGCLYAVNKWAYLGLLIAQGLWLGKFRRVRLMLTAIQEGERGLLGRRDPLPQSF